MSSIISKDKAYLLTPCTTTTPKHVLPKSRAFVLKLFPSTAMEFIWEFHEKDNHWKEFDKDIQEIIEDARGQDVPQLRIDIRNHPYIIALEEMVQTNVQTQRNRPIRRRSCSPSVDAKLRQVEAHSRTIENQLRRSENQLSLTSLRSISALPPAPLVQEVTTLRDLGEHEPEYDYIVSMFQNSMVEHRKSWKSAEWCEKPKVEVTSIESVVNPVNQPLYVFAREEVKRGNPGGCEPVPGISAAKCQALTGSDLNEYFLFHGSCYQQVGEILREGLDPQRGGESAGSMFGKGTYFAENASKADMYTTCD